MWKLLRKISPIHMIIVINLIVILSSYALTNSFITFLPHNYNLSMSCTKKSICTLQVGPEYPPVFAYMISGTGGENKRIIRLLSSIYHPRNCYLLQLDAGSTEEERIELGEYVRNQTIFKKYKNVFVLGKVNVVERSGSTMVAATLQGAAVLLKVCENWDWFINLSSSDYPLVTQDDLMHAFMSAPRDLSFIDHTSDLGWKETERFDKIIIDRSVYSKENTKCFLATETRKTPDAFKIFVGSPWVILSKSFVEDCIRGTNILPRKLLMYFANVAYSMEAYFQTLACNSPHSINKTINFNLRFSIWDNTTGIDPLFINQSNFHRMVSSGAAFARRFVEREPVLDQLDKEILKRIDGNFTYGKWHENGDINSVEWGPKGLKLRQLLSNVIQRRGCK